MGPLVDLCSSELLMAAYSALHQQYRVSMTV
jgi:hypothetical protein